MALNRQLAALGNVQRRRKCTGHDGGGFFNACADVANQIAEVKHKLQAASIQGGASSPQKRMRDPDCRKAKEPRINARKSVQERNPPAQQRDRKPLPGTILFCVRLSDGYRFPTPKSQFSAERDVQSTLNICRYICEDDAMGVYAPSHASLEAADLVAVDTGAKYSDLKTADFYQSAPSFRSCNFQRYHDRVNEARARTVTPYNMADVTVPIPAPRPSTPLATERPGSTVPDIGDSQPRGKKKVRLVGEAFPAYSMEGSRPPTHVPTAGADNSVAVATGNQDEKRKPAN